jgi:segregation and condensation protein B
MFINPIHRFVTLFEQLQEGMSGFSRFYEIITTPDEVDEGTVEIDDIRGVKSDNVVNRLMEFGLVEEAGRLKAPGRPALFKTTDEFLRSFGLSSIKEMPGLPEQETVDFGQQLSLPEQDAETAMDEAEQAEEVSADQETEE